MNACYKCVSFGFSGALSPKQAERIKADCELLGQRLPVTTPQVLKDLLLLVETENRGGKAFVYERDVPSWTSNAGYERVLTYENPNGEVAVLGVWTDVGTHTLPHNVEELIHALTPVRSRVRKFLHWLFWEQENVPENA